MPTPLRLLGFLLLLASALLVLAPATTLQRAMERASGGAVALVEADGTVWNGRGALAAGGQRLALSWRIEPLRLLHGELAVDIGPASDGRAPIRGLVTVSPKAVAIADAKISVPATMLLATLGTAGPILASGEITATVPHLDRRESDFTGTIDLLWQGATLGHASLGSALDLGVVSASLRAAGARLAGPLRNEGGAIDLSGEASVDLQGVAALDLLLTPRGATDPAALALFSAVGRREGDAWRIRWPP